MLKSNNFTFLKSLDYDFFQKSKNDVVIRKFEFEFEFENTCNLECIMCSGELSSSIRKNIEHLEPFENKYNANFLEQLKSYWKNIISCPLKIV